MPSFSFRRFLGSMNFTEVALDGATVWTRFGFTQLEPHVRREDFESSEAARAHYASVIAKLEKRCEEDDAVVRSVPGDEPDPATKKALQKRRSDALVPLRALYRRRLEQARLAFRTPFIAQVRADATSDDVARECLAVAEKAFGVEFARAWTNGADEVPLEDDELAKFYGSPMKVQRIAEKRLLGELTLDDGPRSLRAPNSASRRNHRRTGG